MKITSTLVFLLVCYTSALTQHYTVSELKKLNDEVNTEAHESQPMLTPKGDTLFFIRSAYEENTGGTYSGQDIWYSVKSNGQWTPATNTLENLNSAENNAVVGISATGDQIYLINSYSPPVRRNRGVVYARKDKGIWSIPREVDLSLDMQGNFYGFYMHPEEDVLLISMNSDNSVGEEDLYISLKQNGQWGEIIHLGDVINTPGYEMSPYLSPSKDSLFFSSTGHGGLGDADIFVSTRLSDDWKQWSKPVNLGAPLNSEAFDAYYFQRGNTGYFSSSREGDSDIYMVGFTPDETAKVTEETQDEAEVAEEEVQDADVIAENTGDKELTTEKADEVEKDAVAVTELPDEKTAGEEKPTEDSERSAKIRELFAKEHKVYFGFDSFSLNNESKDILDQLAAKMNELGVTNAVIVVTGYADSAGPENYNLVLSEKRANEVRSYLKGIGITASDLTVSAKGEDDPIGDNSTAEGRAKNRRAEISLKEE